MGLERVSMAASPICTIMGCRKDWKGFYGSVPHLYDNGVQEGLERLPWQRPHLYDNRGKEEIQMCQSPNVPKSKCTKVQMYQSPNVPKSKCTDVPKCHFG